jgi:hypothetical protein
VLGEKLIDTSAGRPLADKETEEENLFIESTYTVVVAEIPALMLRFEGERLIAKSPLEMI